jgi:hypothetical protein
MWHLQQKSGMQHQGPSQDSSTYTNEDNVITERGKVSQCEVI